MAGNDWVNSYLEAILAVDPGLDKNKSSLLLRERGRFSPTRYFVEEVISGFDETDLYRSWIRASSTRSPQERNTRLENMCWRIWNLARKKKQIQSYQARYDAKRRIEQERARRDATADLSDLSEGEKGDPSVDGSTHGDHSKSRMSRINSMDAIEAWTNQQKDKKLYIVLISLHGLIRGKDMELGRDSDTGGQVKYVVELARALGSTPGVYRVDLLTRQIVAPDVDSSYGEPTEMLSLGKSDTSDQDLGEGSGAYIVRIPFGPKDKYVAKELLWPYVQEFVDGALGHIVQVSKVLGDQIGEGQPIWPAAIHGHYADAGNSASLLAGALNVPMLFTGHSLGRDKLEQLLKQGRMSKEEIDATYKIMRRIEAEELCLDSSEIVITSTRQEIEEQWQLYEGFDIVLEKRLRARIRRKKSCHGRFMPRMYVIPPGMEFHNVPTHDGDADDGPEGNEDNKSSDTPIWSEVMRFFSNPRKPMILALARPDPKKNITTLVKAFGESRALQELANLTLIMGNRDDIDQMSNTSASVLISILKMVDKYDLYGQVAYPKHHKQSEVPDIYRLAAKTKGVFINPAFIEPFGLTLIEAAAHGLPFVATKNGGPVDINKVLDSGILIDPHNQEDIANALLTLLTNKQKWAKCRQNGLKNIHLFSWPEHCKNYLSRIALCSTRHPQWKSEEGIEENQDLDADSFRDSFRDSKGVYISLDDEKTDNDNVQSEDSVLDGGSTVEKTVMAFSKVMRSSRGNMSCDKADVCNDNRFPTLRRREHVIVIAVDTDLRCLSETIQNIFKSAGKDNSVGSIGFILSTGLTINETHAFLVSSGISPNDFDAFICSSGSQLFYPPSHMDSSTMTSHDLPYVVDLDYDSQTEYHWGGVDLKKVLVTWAALVNGKCTGCKELLTVDEDREKNRCFAFKVKDPSLAPSVKEARREMRRQGFRCNVIYSQKGDVLHIIPVLASRSQALRYLFLRWGIELKKMVVVVGESGDTDYEGLLGGVNKTIIVTGVGESNQRPAYANKGYALEDSATLEPPYVLRTGGSTSDDIKAALSGLGIIES